MSDGPILIAYCWANGLIEFGHEVPHGARAITRAPWHEMKLLIERHAYQPEEGYLYFVPGICDSRSKREAEAALEVFTWKVNQRNRKNWSDA